jgi:hypothetical protein
VFALKLLAAALGTWALCAGYILHVNPEMAFLKRVWSGRKEWAQRLESDHTNKFVFYGGSSCMFSIDGERMLQQHGLPVLNMGGQAGMNAKVLTEYTLDQLRPGDTLVVALEPGLLVNDIEPTAGAIQFSYAMGAPRWITGRLLPQWSAGAGTLLDLRPGAHHAFAYLGKLAKGMPSYRYNSAVVHRSGFVETSVRPPLPLSIPPGPQLSQDADVLLRSLAAWASTNRVQLYYSLPWGYGLPNELAASRRANANFLLTISEILPVLKDPALGIQTDRGLFSDSEWHLSPEGSAQKTDVVAHALLQRELWTQAELRTLARPNQ